VWDGLSASGVISRRLIADGLVRPLDVGLFAAWHDLWPPLQAPAHDTLGDSHYGIAQGWSADLLMWNSERVTEAPTSWRTVFDPEAATPGGVTAYDSPIAMADAALFLSVDRPELGIQDPYELTLVQFDAVVDLLRAQRPLVTTYWGTRLDQIGAFQQADAVIGAAWPAQLRDLQALDPPVPVEAAVPAEGVTGWADTWMVLAGARHPNCMLRWIAWMISPQVQKQAAEYVGEAPANLAACGPLGDHPGPFGFEGFCDLYHVGDTSLPPRLHLWKTPLPDCGDDRGATCLDYAVWQQQWDEIKAAG
jgi:putative spermidine/putrescine transport system substrate-binding protein